VILLQGDANGKVVPREPKAGDVVTWTGDGFAEVNDKATLEYAVTNVPYTGEYNILVRYEPKVDRIYHISGAYLFIYHLQLKRRLSNSFHSNI